MKPVTTRLLMRATGPGQEVVELSIRHAPRTLCSAYCLIILDLFFRFSRLRHRLIGTLQSTPPLEASRLIVGSTGSGKSEGEEK